MKVATVPQPFLTVDSGVIAIAVLLCGTLIFVAFEIDSGSVTLSQSLNEGGVNALDTEEAEEAEEFDDSFLHPEITSASECFN